ncbi:MAG: glycoside hydrolase family 113 [Chloroflexota bacterium]
MPKPLPEAMLTFRVALPSPLNSGEALYLTVLDEVSGLAFNSRRYAMNPDDERHFTVILPFAVGSVIRYRYVRQGETMAQEHYSDGRPVRYRMAYVTGPGIIDDIVSRWTDTLFGGQVGRLTGEVLDRQTGYPVPGLLIAAGGAQTITAADGTFRIEGLPAGKHNLVAYALDGAYHTFQQEALIAPDAGTPAPIKMVAAKLVTVSFHVTVPADTPAGAVLRLAGNLLQTGNTFADLNGGLSTVAARMPVFTHLPDGRYTLVLQLPAGTDLRYKYTLGDGLWSAEMKSDGAFQLRQLIVPEKDIVVNEAVETWTGGRQPIRFEVSAPTTPDGQDVSIQFNPGFSWMEPIPMWPLGNHRWLFVLTGPLNLLGEIGYRYCREDQCGKADDIRTPGSDSPPLEVLPVGAQPLVRNDVVENWAWDAPPRPPVVPGISILPRADRFVAGVEFLPAYDPTWQPNWVWAVQSVLGLHANWLLLSPTWTFTRPNPPLLEPLAGQDIPWREVLDLALQTRAAGLDVAIVATPRFPMEPSIWWQNAARDFSWWVTWFDQYRTYALHHADLAQQTGAGALILGGETLAPALPGGKLADGAASGVPADAERRWRTLLGEVRERYDGQVVWALAYPKGVQTPPPFLDAVDAVEVLWMAPLTSHKTATQAEMETEAGRLLDANLQPFQQQLGKPVWLGIGYPSADGGAMGCVAAAAGGCLSMDALARLQEDVPDVSLDMQEQVDAYAAMLAAIEIRPWIGGVISRGFFPPLPLQDKSSSVYGKPAAGILWFWYSGWLRK